jgi:hypothetical protein
MAEASSTLPKQLALAKRKVSLLDTSKAQNLRPRFTPHRVTAQKNVPGRRRQV